MKKYEYDMQKWCDRATCMIAYWPDRKKVMAELQQHLLDQQEAFMEQGLDAQEAADRALEAMGDPYAISKDLGRLHKPFWGYFLRTCKIAFVVLLCVSALLTIFSRNILFIRNGSILDFDAFDQVSYGSDTGRTLHHLSEPDVSFFGDGSYFKVKDAVIYTEYDEYEQREITRLRLNMRQWSFLPIGEVQNYDGIHCVGLTCDFYAIDSLGNVYPFKVPTKLNSLRISSAFHQTGLFSGVHEIWLEDFPAGEAQWVEIRYDRDGRNYALRINLRGGVQE